jgi:hypothetical protein
MELTALSRAALAGSTKSDFTKFPAVCWYCPIVTNARPLRACIRSDARRQWREDESSRLQWRTSQSDCRAGNEAQAVGGFQRLSAATRRELIVPLFSLSNGLDFHRFRHELMAHCFKILGHLESGIAWLLGKLSKTETFLRLSDEIFSIQRHRNDMVTIVLGAMIRR